MVNCMHSSQKILGWLTIGAAALSTLLLVLATASDHWIETLEEYEGLTGPHGQTYVKSNFGLWRICSQLTGESFFILPPLRPS